MNHNTLAFFRFSKVVRQIRVEMESDGILINRDAVRVFRKVARSSKSNLYKVNMT